MYNSSSTDTLGSLEYTKKLIRQTVEKEKLEKIKRQEEYNNKIINNKITSSLLFISSCALTILLSKK